MTSLDEIIDENIKELGEWDLKKQLIKDLITAWMTSKIKADEWNPFVRRTVVYKELRGEST